MATFISLVNFTEQGARNIKESPARAEAFTKMAESLGVKVKGIHWTIGAYDLVVAVEGSDEAVTAALLKVGAGGNVRTHTLRAYDAREFTKILGMMP